MTERREYRATESIHLGQYERYIDKGAIIIWDGHSIEVNGEKLSFGPTKFQAALKARWFVPVEDTTTRYQPQPSGATIGPAQRADQGERGQRMAVSTVEEDTRVVGDITQFQEHTKEMQASGGKRKMAVIRGEGVDPNTGRPIESQEGLVIGKLRPAISTTDVSSSAYHEEMRRNSQLEGAGIDKVVERYERAPARVAYTGDVEEARSGADLADLFEQTSATVGYRPQPGPAGAGAVIHDGQSRVAQLKAELAAAEAQEREMAQAAERRAQAASKQENDFILSDEVEVTSKVLLDAKFAAARAFIPNFAWEMEGVHWRTRVAEALKAKPTTLMAIMAVETDTVKRHILAAQDKE